MAYSHNNSFWILVGFVNFVSHFILFKHFKSVSLFDFSIATVGVIRAAAASGCSRGLYTPIYCATDFVEENAKCSLQNKWLFGGCWLLMKLKKQIRLKCAIKCATSWNAAQFCRSDIVYSILLLKQNFDFWKCIKIE